jgi:uncharacterized membrane protein YecN with MAPEG domain
MRGRLLVQMQEEKVEAVKVSSREYFVWLTDNGMPCLQAKVIAQLMYTEQLPMSVAVVLGLINPKVDVRNDLRDIV